jgi:hypothetical protein
VLFVSKARCVFIAHSTQGSQIMGVFVTALIVRILFLLTILLQESDALCVKPI